MKLEVSLDNRKINTRKEYVKRKLACLGNLGMFCFKVSKHQAFYTVKFYQQWSLLEMFVTIGEKNAVAQSLPVFSKFNIKTSKDVQEFISAKVLLGPLF